MQEFDVVGRIQSLCESRSWTYYRLAKESGIPYSTLNTMLHKTYTPTIPSLMKICDGFGITLSQFFSDEYDVALLSADQQTCLAHWKRLDKHSKAMALVYMNGLADRQGKEE